jgi:hypothetical protein
VLTSSRDKVIPATRYLQSQIFLQANNLASCPTRDFLIHKFNLSSTAAQVARMGRAEHLCRPRQTVEAAPSEGKFVAGGASKRQKMMTSWYSNTKRNTFKMGDDPAQNGRCNQGVGDRLKRRAALFKKIHYVASPD